MVECQKERKFICKLGTPTTPSCGPKWFCPPGWLPHGHKCYHFEMSKLNYNDAVQHCQTIHANLVEVNTEEEGAFVSQLLNKMGEKREKISWLGISDVQSGEWNSGEKIISNNWCLEDGDADAKASHAFMEKGKCWVTVRPKRAEKLKLPFICEMEEQIPMP